MGQDRCTCKSEGDHFIAKLGRAKHIQTAIKNSQQIVFTVSSEINTYFLGLERDFVTFCLARNLCKFRRNTIPLTSLAELRAFKNQQKLKTQTPFFFQFFFLLKLIFVVFIHPISLLPSCYINTKILGTHMQNKHFFGFFF